MTTFRSKRNLLQHHNVTLSPFIVLVYAWCAVVLLLLSKTTLCHAFLDYDQIQQVVDYFQETFLQHHGQEFLLRLDRGETIDEDDAQFQELNDIFGIRCLLETLRPDIEGGSLASGAVHPQAYKSKVLCIEPGPDCPEEKQIKFVDKLNATGSEFRYLGAADGAKNFHGVFWCVQHGCSRREQHAPRSSFTATPLLSFLSI
jgi:hypothetical protein